MPWSRVILLPKQLLSSVVYSHPYHPLIATSTLRTRRFTPQLMSPLRCNSSFSSLPLLSAVSSLLVRTFKQNITRLHLSIVTLFRKLLRSESRRSIFDLSICSLKSARLKSVAKCKRAYSSDTEHVFIIYLLYIHYPRVNNHYFCSLCYICCPFAEILLKAFEQKFVRVRIYHTLCCSES